MDSGRKNYSKLQNPGSLRFLSQLQFSLSGFEDFIYTDITLQQIKSSGVIAFIRNKAAVNSILRYDSKVRSALINEKVLGDLLITMQHEMGGILNMQPILESVRLATTPAGQHAVVDSLNRNMPDFLLTHDHVVIGQFYNDYTYYETVATLVKIQMASVKEKAISTIKFLKDQYGLEKEE
ncbi:MAG: hypothetical protein ABI402_08230 [Ferruginibacter sp.]